MDEGEGGAGKPLSPMAERAGRQQAHLGQKPGVSYLIPLCLSQPICKMGVKVIAALRASMS